MTADVRLASAPRPSGRRRFLRLAGMTASAGLLAACAPGLQSPAPAKPAASGQQAPAAGGGPVTLRLASWQWEDPAYKPFWEGTTKAFSEKFPNVTFERYAFPIDQLFQKLNADLAAGSPPDLLELTGFNIFDYASRDVLEPLDEYWAGTDIPEVVMDQKTYPVWDGKQYALNLSARTLQLFANGKLFGEKNLQPPTTLEELTSAARALTDPAREQFGFVGVNVSHSRLYELILLFTAGNGAHFSQDRKPALNAPPVVQAVEYLKSLFDAGLMPKGVKDANAQYAYYNTGKAAMSIDGAWYIAILKKEGPEAFENTKIVSIPTATRATTGGINNVIGIARASNNKALAAEYLKSITDPEWAKVWTTNSQTISARKGAVTPEFLRENPLFDVFNKDIDKAIQLPPPGLETHYNAVQKILDDQVVQVFYENRPVQQTLDEVQRQVEALVAKG